MIVVIWKSLIILPTCSKNPETAVTMHLWSFNQVFFAVIEQRFVGMKVWASIPKW